MLEQYANQLIPTTLASQLLTGATSGSVASAAGLPAQGPFHIVVGPGDDTDEVILVGTISGTTISNLQRHQESTAARTWGAGTPVNHSLTADALRALIQNQDCDYTIFYDGTNYCARNERTGIQDFTSNTSLHNVFNSCNDALGTGHSRDAVGGCIKLAPTLGHVYNTISPMLMRDQVTFLAPGRGTIIRATGGANWTGGNHATPKAVIMGAYDDTVNPNGTDINTMARVKIEGVTIDCNQIAGTSGIYFSRHNQGPSGNDVGGNESHSYINFNEVRDFPVDGIVVTGGGTSACWMLGNNVAHSDDYNPSTARGFNITSADVHVLTGNNVKLKSANGWCMYLAGNSIAVTGELHVVNNGGGATAGMIGLFGADHCRVTGVYFDNLDRCPGVHVNPAGASGVSSRSLIGDNFFHCDPSVTNSLSPVIIDNSQGPAYGIRVKGNSANNDQTLAGAMLKSIVHVINGSSGRNKAQATMIMTENSVMKCNAWVTADFGTQSTVAAKNSAAVGAGANMNEIDNGIDTGSGAGAPANIFFGP